MAPLIRDRQREPHNSDRMMGALREAEPRSRASSARVEHSPNG
jgi:hypothetical protein